MAMEGGELLSCADRLSLDLLHATDKLAKSYPVV